ncbi:LTA synthase family protein [Bacillus sp. DNRA2]|uniref:LTA synthase family protein n=1 Tax=Bacillus sp. DNRA2 TaxID=2723053 RepID=UPI00145D330A|nr:LTA synthase family protein [Bacillus sp. DNRA2]NMD71841.1 LTA synthase family protein [Bacillus sp. DNRA2]
MLNKIQAKQPMIYIAALLLWIKTYIVYKTCFDIKIDNIIQEIILLINPLSFLLFIFGISLFLKETKRVRYILMAHFLLSALLLGNVLFYRFFNDFLTIPVLFQTSNLTDLGSSFDELLKITDLFFFTDFFILLALTKYNPKRFRFIHFTKQERRIYLLIALAIGFFHLGLAETQRPQLLTRTFDREMLIKNIGAYNYQLYDVFLQSKSSAQRTLADGSELVEIENFINANYKGINPELYGAAKGKNVILVSMESMQNFVINKTVNGQEITPFLNEFIKESYYFDQFYHQTGQGKTSDSEFIVENSLYPLSRGAVFFTHAANEYNATPEILSENGYFTASLHANNKTFWNRDIMYKSLGYDRFYAMEDFDINETNSIGWGLKDREFFEQSIQHLQEMPQPFYAKFITLTNHFPFEIADEDRYIEPFTSDDDTVNNYFVTVRYTDEALKHFIKKLKDEGLYENSIIILYGDHYGISENHHKAMSEFLGKEITPFESTQLQRVPFIIHIPGQTGQTISTVSGQIDVKPTLLHLLGISTKGTIQFGDDLFAKNRDEFTVLRDGCFITKDYVFTKDTCYRKNTGEASDKTSCEPFIEAAKTELDFSDKIINGDLLRFSRSEQ